MLEFRVKHFGDVKAPPVVAVSAVGADGQAVLWPAKVQWVLNGGPTGSQIVPVGNGAAAYITLPAEVFAGRLTGAVALLNWIGDPVQASEFVIEVEDARPLGDGAPAYPPLPVAATVGVAYPMA